MTSQSVRSAVLQELAALRPVEPMTAETLQLFIEQRAPLLQQLQGLMGQGLPPLTQDEVRLLADVQRVDQETLAQAQAELGQIAARLRNSAQPQHDAGRLVDRMG